MKWSIKKCTALLLSAILMLSMCHTAFAAENVNTIFYDTQAENISIGGGGAFLLSLINPTDSTNYIATCDMNSLYWSTNCGESWNRTETRCAVRAACFADDGTLFTGDYGLYVSRDKGQTLELIYPQNIVNSVSRCGTRETLFAAENYSNALVSCIATYENRVYFATQSWSNELLLLSCNFDGSDLTVLYRETKNLGPTKADYGIVIDPTGIYFSDGRNICKINPSMKTSQKLYSSSGALTSFTKIENKYYFLEESGSETKILYTSDFSSYKNLNDKNTLKTHFTWDETYYFEWHFKKIVGNSSDHIYLIFESECDGLDYNIYGILTYNGTSFEWVFDSIFKSKSKLGISDELGWTYNIYGDIFDISTDPNDDDHIIMANLETVYDLIYRDAEHYEIHTLHSTTTDAGTYTTTGLDVQDSHHTAQDPFNPQHILIATTDMGMQISFDGGASWRRNVRSGEHKSMFDNCYDIYFDTRTEGLVYGIWSSKNGAPRNASADLLGSYIHGGFAVSYDGGINWNSTYSSGLPANVIPVNMSVVDNGDSLTIAVATFNHGFYISYDSGKTFTSINGEIETSNGGIWGEDVEIVDDVVYCLTAYDQIGGITKSKLYAYDLTTGETSEIDLGDIVIARSLTYDEDHGLFISVIAYYKYKWLPGNIDTHVNVGGGIYQVINGAAQLIYPENDGITDCAFTPDGTMYAVGIYGKLYIAGDGELVLYQGNLFESLKNIDFSNDNTKIYITSNGGGTYRMNTLYQSQTDEPQEPSQPEDPVQMHTVLFKNWDGTVLSNEKVADGETAVAPEDPSRKSDENGHYSFAGWSEDFSSVHSELIITAQYAVEAHAVNIRNAKEATCSSEGYTGDSYCSVCGMLISRGTAIPKLAHLADEVVYNNNATHSIICSICKAVLSSESCSDHNGDGYCDSCGAKMTAEYFVPSTFDVSLSKTSIAKGKAVTMTVKASEDVKSITVNGAKITNYKTSTETRTTGNGRKKTSVTMKYNVFTYTIKENIRGTFTYDVSAYNINNQQSKAKSVTLVVK